jgi:hypothetical protein
MPQISYADKTCVPWQGSVTFPLPPAMVIRLRRGPRKYVDIVDST